MERKKGVRDIEGKEDIEEEFVINITGSASSRTESESIHMDLRMIFCLKQSVS